MTERATQLLIAAGEAIFLEGEPATTAYLIERGEVEISIERAGRRVVLGRRGPGEVFGEMAVIDDKPRSASARALQPCELVPISAEQLARRIEQSDPVLRMCLNVILERFRATLAGVHASAAGSSILAPAAAAPLRTDENAVVTHAAALRELKIERELRDALRRDEFELHFQPIIALRSGGLAGFEALLRWRHPTRGMIAPGGFIPTAEASGLIVDIGRWIVREACMASHRLATLAAPGAVPPAGLFMSINVSGRDIADPTFVDRLRATLEDTATRPQRIKLEITESLLIDQPDRAAATLARCKEVGVSIAIDDFGTGYGSMTYLHQFPIDTLKIDRSFVTAMGRTETSRAIVRSIVGLGRELQLPVVAEGVEQLGEARGFAHVRVHVRPRVSLRQAAERRCGGRACRAMAVDKSLGPMQRSAEFRFFSCHYLNGVETMRRMLVVSVFAIALLAVLSGRGEAAPDREEVGTVDKVQAQAEAIHDGTTRALSPAAVVLYADLLRTGCAARLHAELKDGTQLTLGENGRMLVDDFVYNPGAEDNRLTLRVVRGAFLFVGGKTENGKHALVTIQTPVATLGVRGTTVWGGYIDGRYRVLVLSGEVQVKTTSGAVTLHAGQATAIKSPHDAPAAAHGWSKSRTARAVATVSFAP